MEIEYEPGWVDEAVRRALAGNPAARLYHRDRERAYRDPDPESRVRAFEALDREWFERLGLARPLTQALAEYPLVLAGVRRIGVGRPPDRRHAGADLLVPRLAAGEPMPAHGRALRILVAPESLLATDELLAFLRRELLHVADMLDPRFGYEPVLAASAGPTHERLLRDRYRCVWDVTVDGRLVRAGRLDPSVRVACARRVERAFPALGAAESAAAVARFFDHPAPTHADIVAFVRQPGPVERRLAGACALCAFPTTDAEPDPARLLAAAGSEIARDFPTWSPDEGCCRQCAELYRAAALSRAAAAALPGIRRGS